MSETKREGLETKETVKKPVKEIDYSLVASGPLYVPERLKKPGFVYTFVSNKPGEIEMYQRWGYEVVIDEESEYDSFNKPNVSSRFGSAFTVPSKCGQLLVLMAITVELHNKRMAYQESVNKKITDALGKVEGIPDQYLTGRFQVNKDNLR